MYFQDVKIDDPSINSVYVQVVSADYTISEKVLFRLFEGTWMLIQEDGIWKLDTANIQEQK